MQRTPLLPDLGVILRIEAKLVHELHERSDLVWKDGLPARAQQHSRCVRPAMTDRVSPDVVGDVGDRRPMTQSFPGVSASVARSWRWSRPCP